MELEESLDAGLLARQRYRAALRELRQELKALAPHLPIFLSFHPTREELASVIDQARRLRDHDV
ncbi:hypothetical protein [Kitasatospora aureofaciens]|uniref:hypothetical protein n=1 Tax=Kitasatospora aureofaciens TaxID=1894 RepID=UPI0036F49882